MDNIGNKIITIDKIIEIAKYFEEKKSKYIDLLNSDRVKNKDLAYENQVFEYDGKDPNVEYTIYFTDGKALTENSYDWFISMLKDNRYIKKINFRLNIFYSSGQEQRVYKNLDFTINFDAEEYGDVVKIGVSAENLEEEANKIRNELSNIINSCETRYNKTVKGSKFRIQSFCITIGIALSYILYLILVLNINNLPDIIKLNLYNRNVVVFGQWIIAIIFGNVVSYGIIYSKYKLILPTMKYHGYEKSSHKSIYKEDIEDYINHSEVQIGKFNTTQKLRNNIEKIYKYTWKIILVQIIISGILYIVL